MTTALHMISETNYLPDLGWDGAYLRVPGVYGELEEKHRTTWINPDAVSHWLVYRPWHPTDVRPEWTMVHMRNGDTLRVALSPRELAVCLSERFSQ